MFNFLILTFTIYSLKLHLKMTELELLDKLDELHKVANVALKNKQFEVYSDIFSDKLEYKQPDGRIISKQQLVKDIKVYFDRIKSCNSEFKRKLIDIKSDEKVAERLIQTANIKIQVFIYFSKNWRIEREAIYTWEKTSDKWEISKVEIISEKVI